MIANDSRDDHSTINLHSFTHGVESMQQFKSSPTRLPAPHCIRNSTCTAVISAHHWKGTVSRRSFVAILTRGSRRVNEVGGFFPRDDGVVGVGRLLCRAFLNARRGLLRREIRDAGAVQWIIPMLLHTPCLKIKYHCLSDPGANIYIPWKLRSHSIR